MVALTVAVGDVPIVAVAVTESMGVGVAVGGTPVSVGVRVGVWVSVAVGVGVIAGASSTQKVSCTPFVSFGTRLLAKEASTTALPSADIVVYKVSSFA